jgi:hypothetical protein
MAELKSLRAELASSRDAERVVSRELGEARVRAMHRNDDLARSRERERVLFRALRRVLDDLDESPVSVSPVSYREVKGL